MRLQSLALIALALTVRCAASTSTSEPPAAAPPDPREKLAREHDAWWSYLSATYDADRDGRVAASEYTRGADSFARLDRDGDGAIQRGDFDRALVLEPDLVLPMLLIRMGGRESRSSELAKACDALLRLDTSGDGRVARGEFEGAVPPSMMGGPGVDRFGTFLAGMDDDRDELIARPEAMRWLTRRDVDGDGILVMRERSDARPPPREGFIEPELRELAPDFVATSLAPGGSITLSEIVRRGKKPLALIFGSFT